MNKYLFTLITSSSILVHTLVAQNYKGEVYIAQDKSKANNEVDSQKVYLDKMNYGWAMYYDEQIQNENLDKEITKGINGSKPAEKTIILLLTEILKTEKENTETNKKILEVLQKQYDPQPKKITLDDGTECFENESAKCYKIPAFTPESKLLVYQNFHNNPSIENAKEVIKWEDRHIWEVKKSAHFRQLALEQSRDEIRPYNGVKRVGYQDIRGNFQEAIDKKKLQAVYNRKDKYYFDIFFGDDDVQNIYSISEAYRFYKQYEVFGKPPVRFVFKTQSSLNTVKTMVDTLETREVFKTKYEPQYVAVGEKSYSKLGIKGTISLVAYNKASKKFELITSAPTYASKYNKNIIGFLITKDEYKESEISDYKVNEDNSKIYLKKTKDKYHFTKEEKSKYESIVDGIMGKTKRGK